MGEVPNTNRGRGRGKARGIATHSIRDNLNKQRLYDNFPNMTTTRIPSLSLNENHFGETNKSELVNKYTKLKGTRATKTHPLADEDDDDDENLNAYNNRADSTETQDPEMSKKRSNKNSKPNKFGNTKPTCSSEDSGTVLGCARCANIDFSQHDNEEEMEKYKTIIFDMSEKDIAVQNSLKRLCEQLQKTKKPSTYFDTFKNFFIRGNHQQSEEIDNMIQQIHEYFNAMHQSMMDQEKENQKLNEKASYLQKKYDEEKEKLKSSNASFEQKAKEQVLILKEKDQENQRIRDELNREISNKESLLKQNERRYEQEIAKAKKIFQEHQSCITHMKQQLVEAQVNNSTQLVDLQKTLRYYINSLQESKVLINSMENEYIQEKTRKEELEIQLTSLKTLIYDEHRKLTAEKERFTYNFYKMSEIFKEFNKKISLDDVKRLAENRFVTQEVNKIVTIKSGVIKYEDQIKHFRGNRKDKNYLHIKEMLQRAVEKLDNIESLKIEEIQSKRKQCILYIKELQSNLEEKITEVL